MLAKCIQPQKTALNHSLRCYAGLNPTNTSTMDNSSYSPAIQFPQGATGFRSHTTNFIQGKLRLLTQPDDSHNTRRNFAQGMDNADLIELTFNLTLLNELCNSSIQSFIYNACCPTRALHPLKEVDHNSISFDSSNIINNNFNLQFRLLNSQIPTRFLAPAASPNQEPHLFYPIPA